MHPDLEKLLALQSSDQALLAIDERLAAVAAEEATLDAELARAETARESARRASRESTARRGEFDEKIDAARHQQERRQEKLDHARWRDAEALRAEFDLGQSALEAQERDRARASELAHDLEGKVGEAEAGVEMVRAAQSAERTRLAARRDELQAERAAALAEREARAEQLDRPLRKRYERLWTVRAPRVVVPLANGTCSACFTKVPLSRRSVPGGLLIEGCESCGVILYTATGGA